MKTYIITQRVEFNNIFVIEAESSEAAVEKALDPESTYWQKCVCETIGSCQPLGDQTPEDFIHNIKQQGYF